MANCEICGKSAALLQAVIEGVDIEVCGDCARFGTIRQKSVSSHAERYDGRAAGRQGFSRPSEPIPAIVGDYAQRIKRRREHLGLTQAELAKKLAERESVVSALESGTMEPSIVLAQKIERALSINLVEVDGSKEQAITIHQKSVGMTLGDLIKKR